MIKNDNSHFDKDFEEVLDYYKEKFSYKEQMNTNLTLDKVPEKKIINIIFIIKKILKEK